MLALTEILWTSLQEHETKENINLKNYISGFCALQKTIGNQ